MNLTLEAIPVPPRDDGRGGIRVGQTRVSLESVWYMYQQGASPADIVLRVRYAPSGRRLRRVGMAAAAFRGLGRLLETA